MRAGSGKKYYRASTKQLLKKEIIQLKNIFSYYKYVKIW